MAHQAVPSDYSLNLPAAASTLIVADAAGIGLLRIQNLTGGDAYFNWGAAASDNTAVTTSTPGANSGSFKLAADQMWFEEGSSIMRGALYGYSAGGGVVVVKAG